MCLSSSMENAAGPSHSAGTVFEPLAGEENAPVTQVRDFALPPLERYTEIASVPLRVDPATIKQNNAVSQLNGRSSGFQNRQRYTLLSNLLNHADRDTPCERAEERREHIESGRNEFADYMPKGRLHGHLTESVPDQRSHTSMTPSASTANFRHTINYDSSVGATYGYIHSGRYPENSGSSKLPTTAPHFHNAASYDSGKGAFHGNLSSPPDCNAEPTQPFDPGLEHATGLGSPTSSAIPSSRSAEASSPGSWHSQRWGDFDPDLLTDSELNSLKYAAHILNRMSDNTIRDQMAAAHRVANALMSGRRGWLLDVDQCWVTRRPVPHDSPVLDSAPILENASRAKEALGSTLVDSMPSAIPQLCTKCDPDRLRADSMSPVRNLHSPKKILHRDCIPPINNLAETWRDLQTREERLDAGHREYFIRHQQCVQSEIDLQEYNRELSMREKDLAYDQNDQSRKEQILSTAQFELASRHELLQASIARFQRDHWTFQQSKYKLIQLVQEDERLWGEDLHPVLASKPETPAGPEIFDHIDEPGLVESEAKATTTLSGRPIADGTTAIERFAAARAQGRAERATLAAGKDSTEGDQVDVQKSGYEQQKPPKANVGVNFQTPQKSNESKQAQGSSKLQNMRNTLKHRRSQLPQRTQETPEFDRERKGKKPMINSVDKTYTQTKSNDAGRSDTAKHTKKMVFQGSANEDETTSGVRHLYVTNPTPVDLDE